MHRCSLFYPTAAECRTFLEILSRNTIMRLIDFVVVSHACKICDAQWSSTVIRTMRSWRGSCSAPRTATWPMATLLSSPSPRSGRLVPTCRGLGTTATSTIQLTCRDADARSTPLNRSLLLFLVRQYKTRTFSENGPHQNLEADAKMDTNAWKTQNWPSTNQMRG